MYMWPFFAMFVFVFSFHLLHGVFMLQVKCIL